MSATERASPDRGSERTGKDKSPERRAAAPALGGAGMVSLLRHLQRTAGNAAVNQLLRAHGARQHSPYGAGLPLASQVTRTSPVVPARLASAPGAAEPAHPALQRVILHDPYDRPSDSPKVLKDQLETQETVEALIKGTGQQTDSFDGNKAITHAPAWNFVIGHGALGIAMQYDVAALAANLQSRGIQAGDKLVLITCGVGAKGGDAEGLANALGRLGIVGVEIRAPDGYINWNVDGPVVVSDYPGKDEAPELRPPAAAYTKAEDKAWKEYTTTLKEHIVGALKGAIENGAHGAAHGLLVAFAAKRSAEQKGKFGQWLGKIEGLDPGSRIGEYAGLLREAQSSASATRTVDERENARGAWAAELKGLLEQMAALRKPDQQNRAPRDLILAAQAQMRALLKPAWDQYSKAYFGMLRAKYHDEGLWRTLVSKVPEATALAEGGKGPAIGIEQTEPEGDLDALLAQLANPAAEGGATDGQPVPPDAQQDMDELDRLLAALERDARPAATTGTGTQAQTGH